MAGKKQSRRKSHPDRMVFLDTETTGLHPPRDRIVELAIIDWDGTVLLSTLINPQRDIPQRVVNLHGITTAKVIKAPTLDTLFPRIRAILQDVDRVVIYNAEFDSKFFPGGLLDPARVTCCMKRFISIYEELEGRFSSKRFPLAKAYNLVSGNRISQLGPAHRALSDCLACWHVWRWCDDKEGLIATSMGRRQGYQVYCDTCQKETFFKFRPRYREGYKQYYQCVGCFENNMSITEMDEVMRSSGGHDG